jgi:hypothetical protein
MSKPTSTALPPELLRTNRRQFAAKAWVRPMRWSNWRMGSRPASLESWPGHGWMMKGNVLAGQQVRRETGRRILTGPWRAGLELFGQR